MSGNEFNVGETTDNQHRVAIDSYGNVEYYKKGNYSITLGPESATELGELLLTAATKAARIGPRYQAHLEEDVASDKDYHEWVRIVAEGKAPN